MANISHSAIPDAGLHQCKGVAAALAGAIIVADGAGSSAVTSTASTPVNLYDNELRRAELKDYSETINDLGNVTTTQAIDFELGNAVKCTMTGNTTFTFTNPPSTGNQGSFTLIITQDGTGSRLATWPASVLWKGGIAPTLTSTAAGVDILAFMTVDGGTTWYGFVGGLAFS